ncbi:hypothetical protein [Paenibacillus solani]
MSAIVQSQFGITVLDVIKFQYKTRLLFDYVQSAILSLTFRKER